MAINENLMSDTKPFQVTFQNVINNLRVQLEPPREHEVDMSR